MKLLSYCTLLFIFAQPGNAAEFIPLANNGDKSNTETHTGLWLCPEHGDAKNLSPIKTWLMPTTESVTDGVALKMIMEPGSKGVLTREQGSYPESAGITFYAKASRPIDVSIGKASASLSTEWEKIDFTWEAMGTSAALRKLGWQWVLTVKGPIHEKTWLIIDRLGVESPQFIAQPELQINTAKDLLLSSKDIIYGQEHLQKTIAVLKAKKPLTILALGDSVTEGAQANRGNYQIKQVEPFLYYQVFAQALREAYQSEIHVHGFGHGGWTAQKALTVIDAEIVANANAGDLVVLEFGANDLNWAKVPIETYKEDFRKLIKRCKTKTDQIIILGPTMFNGLEHKASAINAVLQELCTEESVAAVDITKAFVHQGPAFGWAWLANSCHPDFTGHAVMAQLMAPILTNKHINYPFE